MIEDPMPGMLAAIDQLSSAVPLLAAPIAAMYRELVASGVPDDATATIAAAFLVHLLTPARDDD